MYIYNRALVMSAVRLKRSIQAGFPSMGQIPGLTHYFARLHRAALPANQGGTLIDKVILFADKPFCYDSICPVNERYCPPLILASI